MTNLTFGPQLPWWRVRMWWLALGAPLLVALACLALLVVAVRGSDPVLPTTAAPIKKAHMPAHITADTPAQQARNHAATPQR
jgi:uncharacterized protein